jgi:hypothetical protein
MYKECPGVTNNNEGFLMIGLQPDYDRPDTIGQIRSASLPSLGSLDREERSASSTDANDPGNRRD